MRGAGSASGKDIVRNSMVVFLMKPLTACGNESFRRASRSALSSHSVENVSPSDLPTMFSTPTLETVRRHDRDRTSGVGRLAGVVAGNECGMAWVNPQIGRRPGVSAYNLANVLDTSRITTVAAMRC